MKINKDIVVLTKKEYDEIKQYQAYIPELKKSFDKVRKEIAREIFVEMLDLEQLKVIRDMGWNEIYNSIYNEILEFSKQYF